MNYIISILIGVAVIVGGWVGINQTSNSSPLLSGTPILTTPAGGTGTSSPSGILYGDSTIRLKTVTIGSNLTFSGGILSATGGSSGSTGNVSTSSVPVLGNLAYWTTTTATPALLGTVATGTISSGTGISVTAGQSIIGSGLTITNTSPDQTVAITDGTGISHSGTYPNFTITNSLPSLFSYLFPSNATTTNITFSNGLTGNLTGNADTVTNGVYTTTFNNLFDVRLTATTSLPRITTLAGLSLPYSQLTGTPTIASTTLLADSNTFSGTNTFSNTITGSITGLAGTASALAADGANCSAGNYPLGVDASGAVQNCTAAAVGTVTGVTATAPLFSSGGTTPNITYAGIATSSGLTNGQLLYVTGAGSVASAATSTWSFASSTLLANSNTWTGTNAFTGLTATSFNLGAGLANMLAGFDASGNLVSTSSPQVAYINATSTTATSTFAGGVSLASSGGAVAIGGGAALSKLDIQGGLTTTNMRLSYSPDPTYFGSITTSFSGTALSNWMAFNVSRNGTLITPLKIRSDNVVEINGDPLFSSTARIGLGGVSISNIKSKIHIIDALSSASPASSSPVITSSFGTDGAYSSSIDFGHSNTAADNSISFTVSSGSATQSRYVMSLLGNGNVGVGTSSPSAKFAINLPSTGLGMYLAGYANGTGSLFNISTSTPTATSTAFIIDSNGKVGIGSSTPSTQLSVSGGIAGDYLNINTSSSTVKDLNILGSLKISGGQVYNTMASTTGAAATQSINWDSGTTQRVILQANTNFVINATSSNPKDGGKYTLLLCQDNTGSRTATFVTPEALVFWNGTTTISSGANTASAIGMIYDSRVARYLVVASSTNMNSRACTP